MAKSASPVAGRCGSHSYKFSALVFAAKLRALRAMIPHAALFVFVVYRRDFPRFAGYAVTRGRRAGSEEKRHGHHRKKNGKGL
jgi:hypothetical protein